MTQKTISLNEKAYKKLKKYKKERESYSDLIIRLCERIAKSEEEDILLKFAGSFKENADYWEEVEKDIQKERDRHLTSEES